MTRNEGIENGGMTILRNQIFKESNLLRNQNLKASKLKKLEKNMTCVWGGKRN